MEELSFMNLFVIPLGGGMEFIMKKSIEKVEISTRNLADEGISNRVTFSYIRNVITTALWCIVVFITIIVYDIGTNFMYGNALLIASIAIPILVFRPHRIIIDRNWSGIVKSVTRTNKIQSALKGVLERDASTTVPVITIHIERSDGKIIIKKYKLKKDQDQLAEGLAEYYKTDTTVHFFKGIKFPSKDNNIVELNSIAHQLCIVCGNFEDLKHTKCSRCKSTLLQITQ
ncbi:hypothetical protein FACS1894105_03840 [Clostridia bacterium]|nr:hypothetical protein FACS1894105_03840 [Clostridia bacterium]